MEKNLKKLVSKKDYEEILFKIINPVKSYYSDDCSALFLGYTSTHYDDESIPMESFSRIMWGLVPFWSGNGTDKEFQNIYLKGIISGTDKFSEGYWGDFRDFDQKFVEMAVFAYGLLLAPQKIWEPLSDQEKDNFAQWLYEINNYKCSENNWQFFCVLVNIALKTVNKNYSQPMLTSSLDKIESYYIGDGWYKDGISGSKDYYCGFAFHFYGMLYSKFMDKDDPIRSKKFRERALLFGKEFIYWFAEDGSAIPYGRSLTYRFAQTAFFSMCILTDLHPLPLSVMKGIISRHLLYWIEKPIFDNGGILSIGYNYSNLILSEGYNAPGSPYWALKSFAILGLDNNHDFWKIEPEVFPKVDKIKSFQKGSGIIQHTNDNAVLFVPGMTTGHHQPNYEEKYSKFAYSSKYGFSISRSQRTIEECAPDSMLAFKVFDHIFVKAKVDNYKQCSDKFIINWSPVEGIKVESTIDLVDGGHIRTHMIESDYDCVANDCGFAIPIKVKKDIKIIEDNLHSVVGSPVGFCEIVLIEGVGTGQVIECSPNTNLIFSKTAIPSIRYHIKKGFTKIKTKVNY